MLGPILKDVKENGKVYPSLKLMSIKPTNRCTVSSAWRSYHDFIPNGKQLWRQSGFENDHQNHFREKQ
jgi:hypothetical protein